MTDTAPTFAPDELLAHRWWVRGLARSLVHDDSAADDLTQQTMLSALRSPPAAGSNARAWLGTVVRNWARRSHRTAGRTAARERFCARPEAAAGTEDLAERAEAHQQVVRAVLDLPEPLRATVLLRYFEDLPPREIARRMDVPFETARSRLRLAHGRLRGALTERTHRGGLAFAPGLLALAETARTGGLASTTAAANAAGGALIVTTSQKLLVAGVVLPCLLATAWMAATRPEPPAYTDAQVAALVDRVDELERGQKQRAAERRREKNRVASMTERLAQLELDAAAQPAPGVTRMPEEQRVKAPADLSPEEQAKWHAMRDRALKGADATAAEAAKLAVEGMGTRLGDLQVRLATMKLRQLPEAERWERAAETVGLNPTQVSELKDAISLRDTAYIDGSVSSRERDGNDWIVTVTVDAPRIQEADRTHDARVQNTLNAEQRELWRSSGFEGAFGKRRPKNRRDVLPAK